MLLLVVPDEVEPFGQGVGVPLQLGVWNLAVPRPHREDPEAPVPVADVDVRAILQLLQPRVVKVPGIVLPVDGALLLHLLIPFLAEHLPGGLERPVGGQPEVLIEFLRLRGGEAPVAVEEGRRRVVQRPLVAEEVGAVLVPCLDVRVERRRRVVQRSLVPGEAEYDAAGLRLGPRKPVSLSKTEKCAKHT